MFIYLNNTLKNIYVIRPKSLQDSQVVKITIAFSTLYMYYSSNTLFHRSKLTFLSDINKM